MSLGASHFSDLTQLASIRWPSTHRFTNSFSSVRFGMIYSGIPKWNHAVCAHVGLAYYACIPRTPAIAAVIYARYARFAVTRCCIWLYVRSDAERARVGQSASVSKDALQRNQGFGAPQSSLQGLHIRRRDGPDPRMRLLRPFNGYLTRNGECSMLGR